MSVLIVAEHDNHKLSPATLHAIGAATELGEIHLLVAGFNAQSVVEAAKQVQSVTSVLFADAPYYADALAEELAPLVVKLADSYSHIAASANAFGKNLMPRVAALLDIQPISDIVKIINDKSFISPIYAGNVLKTVVSKEVKQVLTFRATAFDAVAATGGKAEIQLVPATPSQQLSRFISRELTQSERPELTQARVVVSGGRALGSAEQFKAILVPLADVLGAAIGASRAAVDAEYAPNDYQVGQTGKVVAPELYIAVGISGAIQHAAGMQDSRIVVAINKDPDAPMFNYADYGLVGDLFELAPELTAELKKLG
ncbi:MAG: FAD-binding protein [Neisseria sp.]|jgi:electron transfer flavoprotein alpha subunit